MSQEVFGSDAFRRHVDILVRLHHAWHDRSVAEAIREEMDGLWDELSEEEEAQVRGVASDLNWVRRGPAPRGPKLEDVSQEDLVRFQQVARRGELGSEELRLMRRCLPRLPASMVAYRRGRIWAHHGCFALAHIFYERAAALEPGDEGYVFLALDALARVERPRARALATEAIRSPRDTRLGEVVHGILLLFKEVEGRPGDSALVGELIDASEEVITRILGHMSKKASDDQMASWFATICLVGGLCHLQRGEVERTLRLFTLGRELGLGANHQLIEALLVWGLTPADSLRSLGMVKEYLDTSLAA